VPKKSARETKNARKPLENNVVQLPKSANAKCPSVRSAQRMTQVGVIVGSGTATLPVEGRRGWGETHGETVSMDNLNAVKV